MSMITKVLRLINCWYDTVPGIGRVRFFLDFKYGREWARRSES